MINKPMGDTTEGWALMLYHIYISVLICLHINIGHFYMNEDVMMIWDLWYNIGPKMVIIPKKPRCKCFVSF